MHFLVTSFEKWLFFPLTDLSRKRLAELCGLTPPRIGQLVDEGVIQRRENGKYDLDQVTNYINFLRQEYQQESDYKDLLEAEKYREKKRENDVAEKLYAPVEIIEEVVEKGVAGVIAVAESLPLIVKRHFPELTGDQVTLIKTGVAEMRNAMAAVEVRLDD